MKKITATIITKNEALNIEQCLQSVSWVDEIIVLDSGSTDGTQEICRRLGAKLIETDWPGFGIQKNRALEMATNDWVLSIDADEVVTEELKIEIQAILADPQALVAYRIPRLNFFQNHKLKYCLNAKHDAPIRLAQKKYAKFSNDCVHEEIIVDGAIGTLDHMLLHHPFRDLAELLDKANLYSTLGAKKLFEKKIKPSIFKTLWHSIWAFTKIYFLKLGFLDGWAGFLIALANFEGTFYRYAKLIELHDKIN